MPCPGALQYSYPLRADQVPPWAVPLIAVFGPVTVILSFFLAGRISRLEAHHAMMIAVSCVATNGVITNFIKVGVSPAGARLQAGVRGPLGV